MRQRSHTSPAVRKPDASLRSMLGPAESGAASAGGSRSALWLDHVHPYEHNFLSAAVLCPMVDVPRFGDDASGPKGFFVATLAELGEPALQDVRKRGTLLMAMKPSNSSWVECNR